MRGVLFCVDQGKYRFIGTVFAANKIVWWFCTEKVSSFWHSWRQMSIDIFLQSQYYQYRIIQDNTGYEWFGGEKR